MGEIYGVADIPVPVVFGLVVAIMIYAVGHISGAHFNPAVTLAFTVARHFPLKQLPIYWVAQYSGAMAACGVMAALMPGSENFAATVPATSWLMALGWEFVLTFLLMFVIIAVATDTRAVGMMAGVAIGSAVMVGAWLGGAVTGASMNPARSFGPNLFQGEMLVWWIYLLGPSLGAMAAAWCYEKIRCDLPNTDSEGEDPNMAAAELKLLFLCVANSARSQMAEALARDLLGDRGECFSAGSQPSGKVHPCALEVLKEKNLPTDLLTSKSVDDFSPEFLSSLDYVITLCAEEVCPLVVSPAQRIHWPLPDPAAASSEEMLLSFRKIRDQIHLKLQEFLSTKI